MSVLLLISACSVGPKQTCDPQTNTCEYEHGWDGLAPNDRFQRLDEPVTFAVEDS